MGVQPAPPSLVLADSLPGGTRAAHRGWFSSCSCSANPAPSRPDEDITPTAVALGGWYLARTETDRQTLRFPDCHPLRGAWHGSLHCGCLRA